MHQSSRFPCVQGYLVASGLAQLFLSGDASEATGFCGCDLRFHGNVAVEIDYLSVVCVSAPNPDARSRFRKHHAASVPGLAARTYAALRLRDTLS